MIQNVKKTDKEIVIKTIIPSIKNKVIVVDEQGRVVYDNLVDFGNVLKFLSKHGVLERSIIIKKGWRILEV